MNKDIKLFNRLNAYNLNLHLLSERSGVAYSTVYNLFTGKKDISGATSESLYKLARFLGMTMDELYCALSAQMYIPSDIFPNFLLMWRDEVISSVSIDNKSVHIDRYIIHPVKQIFYKDELSRFEFGEILRHRCWDESRPDLLQLLNLIGLQEYNPYEICKKTHGKMAQDDTWFKFEGETITYQTLKGIKYAS